MKNKKTLYQLSPYSHYLLYLVNTAWRTWQEGSDPVATISRHLTDRYSGVESLEDLRKLASQCSRLGGFLIRGFEGELLKHRHGHRYLLEAKFYLSILTCNLPKSVIQDSRKLLYRGVAVEDIKKLWHERIRGVPVDLTPNAELKPHINPDDPIGTLRSLIVFFLTEANQDFRRLRVCSHPVEDGKLCLNLFWSRSKNHSKEYCDYEDCKRVRNRDRKRKYDKKMREEAAYRPR